MTISIADVEQALAQQTEPVPGNYSDRDSLLYALAIGMGRNPLDPAELEYVCETVGQRVLPTLATVLPRPGRGAESGTSLLGKMNWGLMLDGEQRLQIYQPLPLAAKTWVNGRVTGVYDKGEKKGALVTTETTAALIDGTPLYTLGSTWFFRGDGGFGGQSAGAPLPHSVPERTPDAVCEMPGREDQAIVYALCGDRNPLHRDPAYAKQAGFDRPILHGLCSYGIACHAVLKTLLDYDHSRVTGFDVRYSAPVYPGETQIVEMWQDGNVISFRVRLKERNVVSINNGKCTIR